MNAFLWLGVASTLVLIVSVLIDGSDGVFDLFEGIDVGGDWLSLPVIAAFTGAFGFGAGAFYGSLGPLALVVGLVSGIVFGMFAARLIGSIPGVGEHGAETAGQMVGALGRIVTAPSSTALGEVLLQRTNGPLKVACRSDRPLALGTEVIVVEVESSTLVVVRPVPQELQP